MLGSLLCSYPDADADELKNIAQTTVAEYGGGDEQYEKLCQKIDDHFDGSPCYICKDNDNIVCPVCDEVALDEEEALSDDASSYPGDDADMAAAEEGHCWLP